jgi:hypothetical protein
MSLKNSNSSNSKENIELSLLNECSIKVYDDEFRDSIISPPTNDNSTVKSFMLKPNKLEQQLDDARKSFDRVKRRESQLGLTTDITRSIITPLTYESLDIEKQTIDRREELGFRRKTFWKSCCGQIIDRRATQFFVQVFMGGGVMIFCMAKIWQAEPINGCSGEDTTVYFSLLSALIGFYIPSPSI